MSFFVKQTEFSRLSGRTKQGLANSRRRKALPEDRSEDGDLIYDIDSPVCMKYLTNLPNNLGKDKAENIRAIQKEFAEKRAQGLIRCAKTGEVDLLGPSADMFLQDEDTLERRKKQREVEYKEKQIEKMDVTLMAMKGGLIEREQVMTWVQRYLGAMHTQILEMSASGICDDLYAIAHKHKDNRVAIKKMEKMLGDAGSKVLKGAVEIMEKNPL